MSETVQVKLRKSNQICVVDLNHLFIKRGSLCIFETEHGVDIGTLCYKGNTEKKNVIGKMLRLAGPADVKQLPEFETLEAKAFDVCKKKAKEKKLEMKLVLVKCLFDRSKIIFYFVAENRVDFRELVRDLASVFRTRIEMRQIGVRDEAKLIGGYGHCGRHLCCGHMKDGFEPVSIKMAKEQNLNLNSLKISGMCGRLLCCLSHEYDVYRELFMNYPTPGSQIEVEGKIFIVETVEPLRNKIMLKFQDITMEISGNDVIREEKKFIVSQRVAQRLLHTASEE